MSLTKVEFVTIKYIVCQDEAQHPQFDDKFNARCNALYIDDPSLNKEALYAELGKYKGRRLSEADEGLCATGECPEGPDRLLDDEEVPNLDDWEGCPLNEDEQALEDAINDEHALRLGIAREDSAPSRRLNWLADLFCGDDVKTCMIKLMELENYGWCSTEEGFILGEDEDTANYCNSNHQCPSNRPGCSDARRRIGKELSDCCIKHDKCLQTGDRPAQTGCAAANCKGKTCDLKLADCAWNRVSCWYKTCWLCWRLDWKCFKYSTLVSLAMAFDVPNKSRFTDADDTKCHF